MIQNHQIEIYCDGACEPINPGGNLGWGFVVRYRDNLVHSGYGSLPKAPSNTNNQGEYIAVIKAMEWLIKQGYQEKDIEIRSDSKLVINQLSGKWRIKKGAYRSYALEAQEQVKQFTKLLFKWIPREQNEEADVLSKRGFMELGEV